MNTEKPTDLTNESTKCPHLGVGTRDGRDPGLHFLWWGFSVGGAPIFCLHFSGSFIHPCMAGAAASKKCAIMHQNVPFRDKKT